jgi:hypothetical protein
MNEWLPKFKGENLLAEIRKSTDGLTYMSETDAPVEPYSGWRADTVDICNFIQGAARAVKHEKLAPKKFFDRLTTVSEWFGPEQTETARRFSELEKLLSENLSELTVFKIGHIQIDIFVVGLDADKNLIGIKTKAVET